MLRLSKSLVLILALFVGLVGLGETLKGTTGVTGSGTSPGSAYPCLEAVLDEVTETLAVTGYGAPLAMYSFRLYYSIDGSTWQHLAPIMGSFDASGEMTFNIPLSVFDGYERVDALMDLAVWNNSGFLVSMPWGMTMQEYQASRLRGTLSEFWKQWSMPLPGTVSPTFTMSLGVLPSLVNQSGRNAAANVFMAGPAPLLQAMYSTGIEGMLPVN